MSYGAAERTPVDIDEFERRMRVPGSRPPSDPLAELARLVNASEAKPDALDEMFARPGAPSSRAAVPAQYDDGTSIDLDALRGPYAEDGHYADHRAQDAEPRHVATHYDAHDAYETEPVAESDWSEPQAFERAVPDVREPRSRKPLYAAAAVIAVGVLGIGSTFAFKGSRNAGGDVVEVKAAPGPVKVAAQAGPDRTNGAADSTLLDRSAPSQPVTRVIDRQERPVDLKEATRAAPRVVSTTPSSSSQMANLAAAAASGNDNGGSVFSEPRKVKTVAVRPDGTVMSNTSVDALSQSTASPTGTSAAASAKGATPKAAARVTSATTPKPADKPEAIAPRTMAAKPEAAATTLAAKPAAPKAAVAKPVRTARVAEPTADGDDAADRDAPVATTRAAPSGGGFSIQLAAPGSEAEAKSTASRLGQKFSGELGGARVTVQKASDKSVYRVRTASMSREDAVAACEKIKAAGGKLLRRQELRPDVRSDSRFRLRLSGARIRRRRDRVPAAMAAVGPDPLPPQRR